MSAAATTFHGQAPGVAPTRPTMKLPLLRRIVGRAMIAFVIAACDREGISKALSETYGPCPVERSDDRHLAVVFMDSPLRLPAGCRAGGDRAQRGPLRPRPRSHYKGVKDVRVAFKTKKETGAQATHTAATYTFTRVDLGAPAFHQAQPDSPAASP